MKRCALSAGVLLLILVSAGLWMNRQRLVPSAVRVAAAGTEQTNVSPVTQQNTPGALPGTIPEADEKDDALWKTTRERETFDDELARNLAALEARQEQGENADAYLSPNDVTFLVTHMQSPHYYARWKAVIAAGGILSSDPARAILLPHVVSLLSDPVWLVRMWAADTLGGIGSKDMIPYLKPLLDDRPEVAKMALKAIKKLEQQ